VETAVIRPHTFFPQYSPFYYIMNLSLCKVRNSARILSSRVVVFRPRNNFICVMSFTRYTSNHLTHSVEWYSAWETISGSIAQVTSRLLSNPNVYTMFKRNTNGLLFWAVGIYSTPYFLTTHYSLVSKNGKEKMLLPTYAWISQLICFLRVFRFCMNYEACSYHIISYGHMNPFGDYSLRSSRGR
jgi:hypothetical protein